MSRNRKTTIQVSEYEPKREGTYKPRIEPDQLRKLWLLKQKTGKPITKLVQEALSLYLAKHLEGRVLR